MRGQGGAERAPHRSPFYALGYTPEELGRPIIAAVSSQNEIVPGHRHQHEVAEAYGIPPGDVIIDPLAMTVGADHTAGVVTLEAIRLIRMNLGVNITLGGGNISFDLPERSLINRSSLHGYGSGVDLCDCGSSGC